MKQCFYCEKMLRHNQQRRRLTNEPPTYACENCWQAHKHEIALKKEAEKPKEQQKICCICNKFLTQYDDRYTDDETKLRYHASCRDQYLRLKFPEETHWSRIHLGASLDSIPADRSSHFTPYNQYTISS